MHEYDCICSYCMSDTGGQYPCVQCGSPQFLPNNNLQALPTRTVLYNNTYLLGRCLGSGGFGITYLGLDLQLNRLVAIKEFLPRQIATRATNGKTVRPSTSEYGEDFSYGLAKFSDEARLLAQFSHPSIVPFRFFFKENDTAYFVMPYLQGKTLENFLKECQGGLSEKELLKIFIPILAGLQEVHAKGLLHRDVKPQNIYLPDHGAPVLLDFGSARQYMANKNRKLTSFLTHGYAPFEQYTTNAEQGPYTDIYGCAATMYACLRTYNHAEDRVEPPVSASDRKEGTPLSPIQEIAVQKISDQLANAIMTGMEMDPRRRPQTVQAFLDLLPTTSTIIPLLQEFALTGIAGQYAGQRIPLSSRPIVVGKDPSKCGLVVEDRMISRAHCRIYATGDGVYVEDLHSSNGTWINDEIKLGRRPVQIGAGDTVSLAGQAVFQIVEIPKQTPAPVPPPPEPEPIAPPIQKPPEPPPPVTLPVRHPENIQYAGFWRRLAAWIIDFILLCIITFAATSIQALFEEAPEYQFGGEGWNIIFMIFFMFLAWVYSAVLESSAKQATFGKAALEIIVTDLNHRRISFGRATGRHFAQTFSLLIVGIGFLMPGLTEKKQAWHDKIAGCLVVKKTYGTTTRR